MAFKCTVVTPETQLFDDVVTGVILPVSDGLIGIQTGHAPMLMKVGSGPLTIHGQQGKGDVRLFIDGGVAQVKDNNLTILTDQAIDPAAIDVEAARKALADLGGFEIMNEGQAKVRQRKVQRAQAMLRAAGATA